MEELNILLELLKRRDLKSHKVSEKFGSISVLTVSCPLPQVQQQRGRGGYRQGPHAGVRGRVQSVLRGADRAGLRHAALLGEEPPRPAARAVRV